MFWNLQIKTVGSCYSREQEKEDDEKEGDVAALA
jgi:hypothetical protein